MKTLTDLSPSEVCDAFQEMGLPSFRSGQVLQWVYENGVMDFQEMTNLSKSLREKLTAQWQLNSLREIKRNEAADGTVKFGLVLNDNNIIESVLIPMETGKRTFCISSQVGCAMGCEFCNTARMGFVRNLTPSEIVCQVLHLRRQAELNEKQAFNVVFMGMGEPLANLDNVLKAMSILTDRDGLNLSRRRITVSTCGIVNGIRRLAREPHPPRLAISLNASDDETRQKIMPITEGNPLSELLDQLRRYPLPPRERFTFEYVLIKNVNDRDKDAANLSRLLNKLRYKINLIPFNPFPGSDFLPPDPARIEAFQQILFSKNITATIRKSKGQDIQGACGQLAASVRTEKE
ncbi:MAG: 23S rRNA (adenine(2503)-C(2))-methyltransferase RlmN [Acidobacteria bacterium CG_4_9_14_3_um_filter_49_7]|nr:MAG: 23S rRNA (adenine(2503)-C(2))-methyltransferase RlmN [Acidobacteria bacterium CG_4_9_14_3_um_filter_49_7]